MVNKDNSTNHSEETSDGSKRDRERSPSFPYIGLEKAVERTQKFHQTAKKFEARVEDAAKAWGLGEKSSATLQTVATLLAFGLIESTGSAGSRKVKISELGLKILIDTRPGVKEQALKEAALKPKLIAEYAQTWKEGRPADSICTSELQMERGFNAEAAQRFLRVYDETISFANLGADDIVSESETDKTLGQESDCPDIKIGDFVQWECNGVVWLKEPTAIRAIQEHQGKKWVFIEDRETGIPMEEVILVEKGKPQSSAVSENLRAESRLDTGEKPSLPLSVSNNKGRRAVFALAEGDVTIIFPESLSKESVEDLDDYIQVFLKKAKREVGITKPNDDKKPN